MPRKRAGSAIGTGKVSGAGKGTGKDANINKGTGIATAWNPNTLVADVSAPVGIQASTTAPTAATLAPNPVLDTDLPNSTGIGMDMVGSNPSQGSHAKTNATTTSAGNAPVTAAPIATTSFVSPTTTASAPALPSAISSPAPTPVLAAPAAPPASSSTPTAISAPESTPTAASTYGNTSATIPVTALPPSRTPPPPPYSPVTPMLGEHNASVAGEFPLLPPGLSLDNGSNVEFDGAGAQEQQQQQLQLSQQQPQQQQQQPEQDQQGQRKQQQQQPIFQPEPTLLPIDSSNPDALALRSALSILQLQRANTLRDMRALARLRQAANEDPMGFAELVASGALDRKESSGNGLFKPGGWNDDQDEEEAGEGADDGEDKNQADANCHMDVDSTAVTDAHQPAARFPKLPHLPTPQAVVRMPPVNWAKYHIAAEPLERLHAQQRRRPDPGQPRRGADGDGDSMAGHGGAAVSDPAAAAGAAPAPAPGNKAHAQAPTSASTVSASAPTTATPQSTAAATTPAPTPTTTATAAAAAAAAAFAPPAQDHVIAAPYRPFEESLAGEPPPPAAVPGGGGATGIGAGGYGAAPMASTVPISGVAATGGGQMQTRRTARTRQSVIGRAAG